LLELEIFVAGDEDLKTGNEGLFEEAPFFNPAQPCSWVVRTS
jgi:hypothetical protein